MRRTLSILMSLYLLSMALPALGEVATQAEARRVGERWLERRLSVGEDWGQPGAARITGCRELRRSGRLLGYLLPVEPRGHIVVSPLKELPAVKAFSARTDFDPAEPGYADLIQDALEATLDFLEEAYGSLDDLPPGIAATDHRASWQNLLAGGPAPRDYEIVGPLLQSDWHQMEPFWDDCPPGDGGLCVVGCVATAAAQILNYWRYPQFGDGSHTYYWRGDDSCSGDTEGQYLSAYYGDFYEWDLILQSYLGEYSPAEATAVAELNYEVGVAFNMDYGHCGSGANFLPALTCYAEFFRYAEGVEIIERIWYDAEGWWSEIRAELDAFPPRLMHYGIVGHAIVCDGYMEDEGHYYHMNYGWGGGGDGWYALDDLYCPWGCDYMLEIMCTGIEPAGYFTVTAPAGGEIWTHGEHFGAVEWWGSEADSVVVDLFYGRNLLARIVDWTVNDGAETPAGIVDPAWGTGSQYRVKVVGDDEKFGWSEPFGIYGAGAWADASADPIDDAGRGQAVAWGDCDGDLQPDLYLVNSLDGSRLFGNMGAGLFTDLTAPPLDDDGYGRGAAWADYDNDGDLDLYLAKTAGEANRLFRNDGLFFTEASDGPLADDSYSSDAAWADYDNDGLVDLYIANNYQADRLLHNEGVGVFIDVAAPPLGDAGAGRSLTWIDYDNDGDQDIHLVRYGSNEFYRNDGGGAFTDVSNVSGLSDNGHGFGAAWADYDNDGDPDLYLANDGANKLLRNDAGIFTDVTAPPLDDPGATRGVSWGDYDNDGWLDLYLACEGENRLFRNQEGAGFMGATDPLLGDTGEGQAAAWADFDGDGDLDLYLVNEGQPNRLFQNDDVSGHHWLHADLVGGASNRSAIGARVRLVAGGLAMTRQVGGDAGFHSQNSLTVEFGLGETASADTLEILWPSGLVERHYDVAADARYTYIEDDSSAPGQPDAAPVFALHGNCPNPFNPRTEIRFSLADEARVTLGVYDLSGRLVRALRSGERLYPAGTHSVPWDGRDDAGLGTASGVYLCQLRAGQLAATDKMVLLK